MSNLLSTDRWTKATFFFLAFLLGIFINIMTDSSGMGLITVSLAFLALVIFERQLNIRVPVSIAAVFVFFIICTLVLGSKFGFYEKFSWWDTVLHTFYGGAFAFIGFLVIMYFSVLRGAFNDILIVCIFSFSFAVAGGALWEIYEFSFDYITQDGNMQRACVDGTEITRYHCAETNERGVNDTMKDIIVETSSAFFVNILIYLYLAKGRRNWVGKMGEEFLELNNMKVPKKES